MRWTTQQVVRAARYLLVDVTTFSRIVLARPLRSYQLAPARAVLDSITHRRGLTFAVMMSRQSGKNELAAQLEAYLLNWCQFKGGQIVKASPTFKPQTVNSMLRLEEHLNTGCNRLGGPARWRRREGYIFELGKARCLFFSAEPTANVVGGTASLLLECDEAQDVAPEKWGKDFDPMGAATNVTTVFFGTAWTSTTMLAREMVRLRQLQDRDGIRRVFTADAEVVGAEVPAYAAYVKKRVEKLGRKHPLIRTQYFLEAIDAEAGMFPAQRQALMRGDHQRRHEPVPGHRYALLVDVAGEDEAAGSPGRGPQARLTLSNPRRDATALTVVDVEYTYGRLPTYRVVDRKLWLGVKHTALHAQILALARHWRAVWVVVDATGVGAGLASFLLQILGDHRGARAGLGHGPVIPVLFSHKVKSDMGWNFLAIVETGRYRDYAHDSAQDTAQFWYEVDACQREVQSGPNRLLRWGVWDTPSYDGRIARGHDDLLMSAALTAILDNQDWPGAAEGASVEVGDALQEIDEAAW